MQTASGTSRFEKIVTMIEESEKLKSAVESKANLISALTLMAFVSINIGIFNLLPLPALDGGRLFFLVIEGIRRKPINPKYEGYVHGAGLALLLLLMVVITFNDIINLVKK